MGQSLSFCCNRKTSYCLTKSERERERERERGMYIRCCDCLRESKSSALIRVLNSRETSAEAALIASFSVCSVSISPPADDMRERERERDANDEMKLWAIYKGLHIIGLFIWVDLTRPNNLDNIRFYKKKNLDNIRS